MYSLAQRVAALDAQVDLASIDVSADIERFIATLAEVVSFGTETVSETPKWRAEDADRELKRCHLLARLNSLVPEIVSGPLVRSAQYWISAEKPPHVLPNIPQFSAEHFRGARSATSATHSTKPFNFGLYTSTGFLSTQGMWRAFLDMYEGSAVPPPVWHVWRTVSRQDARIFEITTAVEWAAFVHRFPNETGGWLYPDWQAAAAEFDAIHVTIRAIASIQGVCLQVQNGITAPTYWDVESTFWLSLCFESYELTEIVCGSS